MASLMAGAAAGSWPAAVAIVGIAAGAAAAIWAVFWAFSKLA